MKHGKNYRESLSKIEKNKLYDIREAFELVVNSAKAKFDETVELHVRLGVDSRHADQQVRGAVVLPNGTGRNIKVLVFAKCPIGHLNVSASYICSKPSFFGFLPIVITLFILDIILIFLLFPYLEKQFPK